MLSRIWAKIIIRQLKRSAVNNESVLRVLVHYLLLEMQKQQSSEIEIKYSASDKTETELLINCKLKGESNG